MNRNQTTSARTIRALDAVAAGTGTNNGVGVDCLNCNGVQAVISLGTVVSNGVTTVKWQDSPDNSAWTDVGSSTVSTTDNGDQLLVTEIAAPSKRYVRIVVVTSVANVVIDSATYTTTGERKLPVTQSVDVVDYNVVDGADIELYSA